MNPLRKLPTNWRNDGRRFQDTVRLILDDYERRGVMKLEKCDPPTRRFGRGVGQKTIFLENPFPDFVGSLTCCGGRMVVLELKSTSDPRLPINVKSGGVTVGQVNLLGQWHKCGAVGGLLWEHPGVVEFIPTANLLEAVGNGLRSLPGQSCYGVPIQPGLGYAVHDFAPAIIALAR